MLEMIISTGRNYHQRRQICLLSASVQSSTLFISKMEKMKPICFKLKALLAGAAEEGGEAVAANIVSKN